MTASRHQGFSDTQQTSLLDSAGGQASDDTSLTEQHGYEKRHGDHHAGRHAQHPELAFLARRLAVPGTPTRGGRGVEMGLAWVVG
ncbi:hypothetical protein GCM10023321_68030 [Pseudonocardia eucalypti]|uniref:Uncharacterized protein n=1 Tax=Pseudonocardia eucalypti TaxID=648755 RepID=A0ABP9R2B9_9PSEU